MFVREIPKENGSVQIVIVESVRTGNKVHQKRIRSFGCHSNPKQIAMIKDTAQKLIPFLMDERSPFLPGLNPGEFCRSRTRKDKDLGQNQIGITSLQEESRTSHGVSDVFGAIYEQLKLADTVQGTRSDEKLNELLKCLVLERVRDPSSKLKTSKYLNEQTGTAVPVERIYRLMDKLVPFEEIVKEKISAATLNILNQKVDLLLFDVTTLYFESFREDELRKFGFSKDCKFKETQVVLALVTTKEGLPITYELFPGNTSEANTLVEMIKSLKQKLGSLEITLVADRAMFSEKNLSALEQIGATYVVAARLKSLNREVKAAILDSDNRMITSGNDWVKELSYNDRRLIVSFSQKRADKDQKDRERLVVRMMKKIKPNGQVKLTQLINNRGTKKYLKVTQSGEARLNEEKIKLDQLWDGIHGVITNDRGRNYTELLSSYRNLWRIEEAFRINKTDLSMRPIYHWKPSRIKAHILICFMAFSIAAHLRHQLKENGLEISINKLREELKKIQTSIVLDKKTKVRFRLPSQVSELQERIYKIVGLSTLKTAHQM